MEIQTWVSLVTIVAAMAGLYAAMRRDIMGVRTELKAELKGDIGGLRTELKADIGRLGERVATLDDRVATLDDRVYALAVGLQPTIEARRHGTD